MIRVSRGETVEPRKGPANRLAERVSRATAAEGVVPGASGPATEIRPLDIPAYIAAAGRHKRLVAAATVLGLLATLAGAMMLPRAYEAGTRLLIDPRGLQVLDRELTPRTGTTDQSISVVESEMRVVTSDVVLGAVIARLGLAGDAELNGTKRYAWSPLMDIVGWGRQALRSLAGASEAPTPPELAVLRTLQKAARVRREPQSFVVDLLVRTEDAAKSARIADAIAQQYLATHSQAKSSATQRASDAMSGRLDALRRRLQDAEEAAERYKRDNQIVVASGRLVSEQQLSELNSQLTVARGEVSKASVRIDQIRQLRQAGIDPDSIPEALQSESINRLKVQHAAIRRREASLLASLLPSHPVLKQVRQELADSRRQISEEVARLAEATRLDLDRARNNVMRLERNLAELKELAVSTSEKFVRLRELEREVEASRAVYATFLNRTRELSEQRRLDTSMVAVLSPAVPPKGATGLPLGLILLAGTLGGLGLGLAGAVYRDRRDAVLRGTDQLAALGARGPVVAVPGLKQAVRLPTRSGQPAPEPELIPSFVVDNPDSAASLAVARLVEDIGTATGRTEGTAVLVTAAAAFEGKSTIAVNMALAAARSGDKVLLVDGDLEQRTLSEAIDAASHRGLADVIAGRELASAVVLHVAPLGIDVLPAGLGSVRLSGRANRIVEAALRELATPYDLVVIDGGLLPNGRLMPALAAVSAETVVVVRAGVSRKAAVAEALAAQRAMAAATRTVIISG